MTTLPRLLSAALLALAGCQRQTALASNKNAKGVITVAAAPPKSELPALPPEAKAYAESKVGQFVGANKMFKTADEWKSHYAKIYFDKE